MTFDIAQAGQLENDPDLSERVEAFVSRFARLQDMLGDKLLPEILSALGERVGAVIDNLDRAERLGLLTSADEWLVMRNLRNQMVHEYVEDVVVLNDALQTPHNFVPALLLAAEKMMAEANQRGWL
jgi:phosphoglycolate phosphatase-like HAD superfamily hydrolase